MNKLNEKKFTIIVKEFIDQLEGLMYYESYEILNQDLTDYFDLFIQKLINNWLVVIENVFKFTINQYRINTCILNLIDEK